MKRLLGVLLFTFLFASVAFAQQNMAPMQPGYGQPMPQALPTNVVQFIEQNFNGATVTYFKFDSDDIDVVLTSGAKVEFYRYNGEWKEIECYQNFPTHLLPQSAVQAISSQNAVILKAEREMGGFKIKASNRMKYYVSPQGQIMGQKFDD